MNESIIRTVTLIIFCLRLFVIAGFYNWSASRSYWAKEKACLLAFALLFYCMSGMFCILDYNEPTLQEYKTGYNAYPDNQTYDKIINSEHWTDETRHYKSGWEHAEESRINSGIKKSNLLKKNGDLKNTTFILIFSIVFIGGSLITASLK